MSGVVKCTPSEAGKGGARQPAGSLASIVSESTEYNATRTAQPCCTCIVMSGQITLRSELNK